MAKNFAKDVAQSIAMDYAKGELKDGFGRKSNGPPKMESQASSALHQTCSKVNAPTNSSGEGYKVPVNWNMNSNMSPMAKTFHATMQKRPL